MDWGCRAPAKTPSNQESADNEENHPGPCFDAVSGFIKFVVDVFHFSLILVRKRICVSFLTRIVGLDRFSVAITITFMASMHFSISPVTGETHHFTPWHEHLQTGNIAPNPRCFW